MIVRTALPVFALIALTACSQQQAAGDNADDFAARVGGAGQPAAASAPAVTQPGSTAPAEGAIAEPPPPPGSTGLTLAPGAETCSAPQVASYLNQPDSPAVRQQIMAAAANASEIRFLPPGTADRIGPRKDRLNVMIDTTGVIRDLRCG